MANVVHNVCYLVTITLIAAVLAVADYNSECEQQPNICSPITLTTEH